MSVCGGLWGKGGGVEEKGTSPEIFEVVCVWGGGVGEKGTSPQIFEVVCVGGGNTHTYKPTHPI